MEINWLPIGSVVTILQSEKPFMICGRAQKERDTGSVWDYSACPYPEGNLAPEKSFLFNKESIEKLLFIGYQTEENAAIAEQLDEFMEKEKEKEQVEKVVS